MTGTPITVLSFDFGLRYIGVAAAQSVTGTARGIATLNCREGVPAWREVEALVARHKPDQLIVGLPLNMDGSRSEMCEQAERFASELARRVRLDVSMQDERLTSKLAAEFLPEAEAQGQARTDHELAACFIAEDYLRSWSVTPR